MIKFSSFLKLAAKANRNVTYLSKARFAGGHHHDEGHHAPAVHIDTKQNWVGNKNVSKEQVAVFGFKDEHDHHHEDHTDPYAHLRGKEFFSFERMYFADAYYHPDAHEPLMNEPHGYLTMDDPMDVRNNIERASVEYLLIFCVAVSAALLIGYQRLWWHNPSVSLYETNLTANMLEDEMLKIREENKALENRKQELVERLNASN